jgi:hypothetical protein
MVGLTRRPERKRVCFNIDFIIIFFFCPFNPMTTNSNGYPIQNRNFWLVSAEETEN